MSTIASSMSALSGGANSAPVAPGKDPLTAKETFLKLLVAQIKNQDPTNPTDATQFVGQLTQYSQLEQLMEINQNLAKVETPPPAATPPTT